MRKSLLVLVVLMLATVATADVEVLNTGWGDLSIASLVQFRFTETFNTAWTLGDHDQDGSTPNTWASEELATGDIDFRRAVVDLKGSITEYWAFLLSINVLGNADLNKYQATFKPVDILNIHFGRLQTPFSFETQVSGSKLAFVENSLMSALNPGIKDGAMVEVTVPGGEKGTFYLNLKLGAFDNGGNSFGYLGGANDENIIDYAASVASMPIPGLVFGGYFYMGNGYQYEDPADPTNTDFFNTMAYGGGAFYNPSFGDIDLKVGGEYAMGTHGFASMEDIDGVDDVSWMGYYGMLMVGFNIGSDFLDRIEIGGAYEGLDLNTADVKDAADELILNGQAAVTIGMNLYFSEDHHAKLQLDYQMGMPEDEHGDGNGDGNGEKNDAFIAQLQLMF